MKIVVRRVVCRPPDQATITLSDVEADARIIDVKRMVQREWGIDPEAQRLIFSGRELGNNQTVADCKITDECVVQLVEGLCRPPRKIFVVTLAGETIPVDNVNGSTTVLDVKFNLQFTLGLVTEAQRLIFAGRQLEDSDTLEGCNIRDESTLHAVLRLYHKIAVKMFTGETITLDYERSATIGEIKGRCPDIAPGCQKVIKFDGREMMDDDKTLGQCGIRRGSTLRLVLRSNDSMDTQNSAGKVQIKVKWNGDESFQQWVEKSVLVGDIKELISFKAAVGRERVSCLLPLVICFTQRSTHMQCSNVWCALLRYSRTTA